MLELNAASFYGAVTSLHIIRLSIREALKKHSVPPDGSVVIEFETDPVVTGHLLKIAQELIENLRALGLRMAQISADKLRAEIVSPRGFIWSAVASLCDEINARLMDELSLVTVLSLSSKDQSYYAPTELLFGSDFAAKFASEGAFEVDEAAKCLALGRPTATVFHLMRVMEVGIRALARCLDIPDPVKPAERNWAIILQNIKAGIDRRWPHAKDRMEGDAPIFDALYASLDAVKNPWRNAVMHVEGNYTEDQAEHIFIAVKGFMKRLSSRCDAAGEPKA